MLSKRLLALIGILAMAVGVLQVFKPQEFWEFWDRNLIGYELDPISAVTYIVGGFSVLLGLFLLYVGLRKLTRFSTLIWVIGLLSTIAGVLLLVSPRLMLDLLNAIFFKRSYETKMVWSYITGIIRFFIGVLFVIAGLSRTPSRGPAVQGETQLPPATPPSE